MKATIGALALCLALSGTALGDVKPGEQKDKKAPDEQGFGKDGQAGQEKQKNPLPGIVELMKKVEQRIAETDSGSWTQEEQKRIIEALEFEKGVIEALQKLIEEVESRPPEGSGQSSGDQQDQKGKQSQGRREQQLRERQQERQEKSVDPQSQENSQKNQKGQRDRPDQNPAKNDQKTEGDSAKNEYELQKQRAAAAGEAWGKLPPKAAREVIESQRREPPVQWKKQIDDYFKKLKESNP